MENFRLGAYLRSVREDQNLSMRELARRAKESGEGKSVTASQISNIENGKSDPGFETLQKLAELLDIPLVFILNGSEENIDAVTVVSTDEITKALLRVLNREKLIQLLTFCMDLTDEQIDAILGVARIIRNFTQSAREAGG